MGVILGPNEADLQGLANHPPSNWMSRIAPRTDTWKTPPRSGHGLAHSHCAKEHTIVPQARDRLDAMRLPYRLLASMASTRYLLLILGVVVTIALGARAICGPFLIGGIWVRSPLTLESVFGVIFLALTILGATSCRNLKQGRITLFASGVVPLVVVLTIVSLGFIRNLNDPFLSDDYILVNRASLDPSLIASSFHTAGGDGSFRPIGSLYFGVIRTWAHLSPWKWHVCALGVHLINCALLYLNTQALWSKTMLSCTAALLFGLHGTRPEVVTWTAGNFDLLACSFTLAATLCVFRQVNKSGSYAPVALALVFLIMAILSKESAYAAPVVALGFAMAGGRLRDRKVLAFLLSATLVCVIMFAYRWSLFGGPGGYIDTATGRPQILSLHFVSTAKAIFIRPWAIFLFPLNWETPTDAWVAVALLVSSGVFLYVFWIGGSISTRVVLPTLAMIIVSILPAIHLALIGESVLGSRVLYLPSIGFCILCGHLVISVSSPILQRMVLGALTICAGIVLLHNLKTWHAAAVLADEVCTTAAHAGLVTDPKHLPPAILRGVFFFKNGFSECVTMKREQWLQR